MKYSVLLCVLFIAGCAAVKTSQHGFFCIGACLHNEIDVDKKKGEDPKDLAPCPDGQFRADVWDISLPGWTPRCLPIPN